MSYEQIQGALFDLEDIPEPQPAPAPRPEPTAWNYACHLFQRSGPAMWKLGETGASPLVRARQIKCTPVAWWYGTLQDERRMHKLWKHHRVSPAAEFFWQDGDQLDRFVLRKIQGMPATLLAAQLEVFADIEVRWWDEQKALSAGLLMDLLTSLSAIKRTQAGEASREKLELIFHDQLRARKQANPLPPAA